jgi:hypothetical protein
MSFPSSSSSSLARKAKSSSSLSSLYEAAPFFRANDRPFVSVSTRGLALVGVGLDLVGFPLLLEAK